MTSCSLEVQHDLVRFKMNCGKDHGLDYHSNKKAWMNCSFFFDWIYGMNADFAKHNRTVLLLIDNYRAHGTESTFPTMNNVDILFLPPSNTCKL